MVGHDAPNAPRREPWQRLAEAFDIIAGDIAHGPRCPTCDELRTEIDRLRVKIATLKGDAGAH